MGESSGKVHLIYAIVGSDRFLRSQAVDKLVRRLADELDTLTRVSGADAVLAEVLDEVRTVSLLGSRRVVVVEEAASFISAHRATLERYCAEPSPSGCLILSCPTLPKNTRLYRIIATHGAVLHEDPPKGRAVLRWIATRAQAQYGKRLTSATAQALREQLGDSPGGLDAELAKLAAYVGQREEIAATDIEALTGHHRQEKVFAVTDSMSAGDAKKALQDWEQVLATDRAAPARAIAGLAWGIRRLREARSDWDNGVDLHQLARRLYTDPALLRRRLEQVSAEQLAEQQRDLLAADLAVKTGASTIDSAVEKFIVKHSAPPGGMSPLAVGRAP